MPFLAPVIAIAATAVASAATAVAVGVETAALALGLSAGASFAAFDIAAAVVPSVLEFGALAGASALLTPKPKVNTAGSPQSFKADPQAPVPFVMGRYGVAGNLVYETTTGGSSKAEHGAAGNEFLTQFVVLSAGGPIEAFESLRLDNTILTFSGQNCTGGYIESAYVQSYNPGYSQNSNGSYANNTYADHIWQYTQTGAPNGGGMGYPSKINNSNDYIPEWTPAFGLSYFGAAAITRSYDTTVWTGGVGTPQWTIKGYRVYDPRLDSSYPGGSGAQRWPGSVGDRRDYYPAARATWAWSENPIIHALNYALGHYLPDPATGSAASDIACGRLYAGCGVGFDGVDVDAFVRAANNADANGWRVCGQWTTGDGKRSVLTAMLQAGGAQLVSDRGRISCTFSAPVTAVNATPLTWADLAGAPSLDTTIGTRDRTNTAFYSYSSEVHRWQVVQADTPVQAATYVTEDGGIVRSKKLTFEYVPSVDQAAQLAAYAIVDGRELPNIVLPGKPHLRGYAPGDGVLVDLPELGLHLAKLVVLKRSTDPATGLVTLTCRSETDAKHAYALGRSGVAPATPSISGFDPSIVPAPIPASWAAEAMAINDPVTGEIVHVIRINGTTIDNVYAAQVVVTYAQVTAVNGGDVEGAPSSETFAASQEQIDLNLPAGRWHVTLRYITITGAEDVENALDLGIITVGGTTSASTVSVPGAATFGDEQQKVADLLADIATQQALIQSLAMQIGALGDPQGTIQQDLADAQAARDAAQAALAQATTEANLASGSASDASGSASGAAGSAAQASGSATSAGQSATAAQASAVTANTKATNAATSASAAATSASGAAASQTAAGQSASSATGSANTATTKASDAAYSASAASGSASSAASSSSAAGGYASSAQQYSSNANTSAGQASVSAGQAAQSKTGADGSASNAATYASQAAASLTGAQGQAAAAMSSATAAASSAGAAAASASSITASVGRNNLVTNPSFALGAANWLFAGGVYFGAPNSTDANAPFVAVVPPTNVTSEFVFAIQTIGGIVAGLPYSLQGGLYSDAIGNSVTYAAIEVVWLNSGGGEVGRATAPRNDRGSWGGPYKIENQVAPSGAVSALVRAKLATTDGSTISRSGGAVGAARVKLEQGTSCSGFSDEKLAASVVATQTAVASVQGYVGAYYGLQVSANGVIAGLSLMASSGAGYTPISSVKVSAANFIVQGPSGAVMSFTDTGGGTLTVANLVARTANIAAGAVTQLFSAVSGGAFTLAYTGTPAPSSPAPTTGGGTGTGGGAGGGGGGRGYVTP